MKEPRINVSLNIGLAMYQWLAQAAEKRDRTVAAEAKARLLEMFLREHDERRKHNRTAGN